LDRRGALGTGRGRLAGSESSTSENG